METSGSSVLLFGCGKIGIRLGEGLVEAGHRVFAVRRDIEALPRSFKGIALDYRRPFTAELPSVDSMVITLTPGTSEGEPPDLVNPLRRIATALPARPRRVILVSSTRVFDGDPGLRMLTEDDTPRPASPRAGPPEQRIRGPPPVRRGRRPPGGDLRARSGASDPPGRPRYPDGPAAAYQPHP